MNAGKAIYYLLSNASSVTDICGTRIYPELAEQEAPTPFVVYEVISVDPDDTNDGPAKMDEVSVDITAVADSYDTCADLASAIRSAIDRVRGTYNGVNVDSIQYSTTDTDVFDSPRRYAMTAGFIIRISRDDAQIATGQPIDLLTILRLADTPSSYGTTGQALVMNAEGDALEWGETASALGDLTDVNLDEPIDRHALVYDEDTDEWVSRFPGEIPVFNGSGEVILKGQCAVFVGSHGDRIQVKPFDSGDEPLTVVGIATEEMAHGETGHVITLGEVRGLDTDQFNIGDRLYPTGVISSFSPFGLSKFGAAAGQPDNPLPIAVCNRSHANTGRIFVRVWSPGYIHQIAGLSDVNVPYPYLGAVLKYVDGGGAGNYWGYLPQTSKSIFDGATDDLEIYYYATSTDTQQNTTARSDTPSKGNKIVRKIWYKTEAQYDPDAVDWVLYEQLDDNATFEDLEDAFNAALLVTPTGGFPVSIKTTWEDVPAFTGLLDTYSGAAAAYSLRLLDSTYTGDAIRVRRASDNAEQDIGFADNELDTSALATFCAGTDGFVKTWYDQSGNGVDATQASTSLQPKIYDSSTGVIVDSNGKARLSLVNSENLVIGNLALTEAHGFAVFSKTALGYYSGLATTQTNNHWGFQFGEIYDGFYNNSRPLISGSGTIAANTPYLISIKHDGTMVYHLNGSEIYNAAGVFTNATNLQLKGVYNFKGYYSEIIIYGSDKSSDRAGIESNINDFYTIY